MLIAAVSDVVWQALIAAAVTLVLAWMQQRTKDSATKDAKEVKDTLAVANELVASKADEVKDALVIATKKKADETIKSGQKIEELTKITLETKRQGEAIHTLVNSNMGVQLKIAAVALRRVAELTKEPSDLMAAETADKALAEHDKKQEKVDKEN